VGAPGRKTSSRPCRRSERGARHINVNILRYFSEPAILDDKAILCPLRRS